MENKTETSFLKCRRAGIMKLKQFRGIEFDLFSFTLNQFDGYGLTFFRIGWNYANGITWSNGATLFYLNWKKSFDYGGEEWSLTTSLFFKRFKLYTWVIKPRKKECLNCGEYCDTTNYFVGSNAYCCSLCQSDGGI